MFWSFSGDIFRMYLAEIRDYGPQGNNGTFFNNSGTLDAVGCASRARLYNLLWPLNLPSAEPWHAFFDFRSPVQLIGLLYF
jgi:hypothetical protein